MVKYNPDVHHRRSIRLKGYDYSQEGLYFVTVCVQNKLNLFGRIENRGMVLNDAGVMIKTVWYEIPKYYNGINIDAFQIMPNHIHGIIQIINKPNPVGAGPCACPNVYPEDNGQSQKIKGQPRGGAPTMSLSDVVHRVKTLTTKRYIDGIKKNNWLPFDRKLWQRNYHDHIIRDEQDLNQIREYIMNNPLKWQDDEYYE